MGGEAIGINTGQSKRRRASEKSGRRFSVKDSSKKRSAKKHSLPSPATVPRKAKKIHNAFRMLATWALFFVFLSTMFSWRARGRNKKLRKPSVNGPSSARTRSLFTFFNFRSVGRSRHRTSTISADKAKGDQNTGNQSVEGVDTSSVGNETTKTQSSLDLSFNTSLENKEQSPGEVRPHFEIPHAQEEPLTFEELPERIEWYTRDDFKDGSRPMCRISKPIILSNGTLLFPNWMANYEKLLQRCGLGTHSFYSTSSGPEGLERTRDIDADFALTIHPERFQEPTHVPSVFLTEHILKSSYLFDVFGGDAQPVDGIREHHCYTTEKDSSCTLPRPVKTLLRPAIFVPKKIELSGKGSWTYHLVDMFGIAHGHGHEATHLNASTILLKAHEGKSENLIGTSFRSILTTDGMFRHLPSNGLQHSNFYSEKNGISKAPKLRNSDPNCQLSIGIAQSGDALTGIDSVSELKEKIEVLTKIAVPGSQIEVKLITFNSLGSLEEHVKDMQDIDIYVGGSGDEMSSIGFLRSHSSVMELMPFGVKPNTHESLARILGLQYLNIGAKPQIDPFRRCIDGEIFNLRKKGKLSFTEVPEWHEPLMKAWDDAVGEFVLSGKSNFDLLTEKTPIKNYHSRVCALRQKIEVGIDEVSRKIVLMAKEKCSNLQSPKQAEV